MRKNLEKFIRSRETESFCVREFRPATMLPRKEKIQVQPIGQAAFGQYQRQTSVVIFFF